jgi:hypothetical protein
MSQNDLVIANQSFPATRADINSALQALGSSNSGTTEPATIYANMFWYDTTTKILKLRSEANDAWISVGFFCQSANAFRILDDTQVTNTSGTQTGLLGDQATATWETGTSTTESLVSPAKVKAAISSSVVFSASYISAEQTITAGGLLTLTHSLGAMPSLIQARIVCKTAQFNYSIGDELVVNNGENAIANASYGHSVVLDSTNLTVRYGVSGGYQIFNKSTGAAQTITAASWRLVVRAWA